MTVNMVNGSPTAPADAATPERLAEQVASLERECGRLRVRHEDLSQRIAALEVERAHLQRQLVEHQQRTAPDGRHDHAVLDRLADASVSEQAMRKRLDEALATIDHMQQSRFWKVRTGG